MAVDREGRAKYRRLSLGLSPFQGDDADIIPPDDPHSTLGSLPLDILHEILQYIELKDLIAVSYTSRLLNAAANRYIYRNLDPLEAQERRLRFSLQQNPSNLQYIHTYKCYETRHLAWLWSYPLKLRRLELNWSRHYRRNPFLRCLALKHRDFSTKELSIEIRTIYDLYLIGRLDCLTNLTSLNLCDTLQVPLEAIVDSLNGLQIRHLAVSVDRYSYHGNLKDKLPCLVSFDLQPYNGTLPTYECWSAWTTMKNQSIYFRVRKFDWTRRRKKYSRNISAWSFYWDLVNFAEQHSFDPCPLIQWHAKSSCFFNTHQTSSDSISVVKKILDLRYHFPNVSRMIDAVIFPGYQPHTLLVKPTQPCDEEVTLTDTQFVLKATPQLFQKFVTYCLRTLQHVSYLLLDLRPPFPGAEFGFMFPEDERPKFLFLLENEIARSHITQVSKDRELWTLSREQLRVGDNRGASEAFLKQAKEWFEIRTTLGGLGIVKSS